MKKGNLTPDKTAKQRARRRRYEKQRNIFNNQSKQTIKRILTPPKQETKEIRLSFWQRLIKWIKSLWQRIRKGYLSLRG